MALPMRSQGGHTHDPFAHMHREFDNLLGDFFGRNGGRESNYLAPYAVDVREDADHIFVEAELPGFKKEEVDITLENQVLTIAAERKQAKDEQKKGDVLLNERRYTRFLRSFTLPPTVDSTAVDAKLNDGVLTLTLNKRPETKPRKVTVS